MYLWLKQGAEEQLQVLKEQGLVGDLRVETDRTSGKKYINTYTEVSDPTSEIAEALGVSKRSVSREWQKARALLLTLVVTPVAYSFFDDLGNRSLFRAFRERFERGEDRFWRIVKRKPQTPGA